MNLCISDLKFLKLKECLNLGHEYIIKLNVLISH